MSCWFLVSPQACPFSVSLFECHRCDSLINIVAGQTITLSCNSTLPASSTVLPISYPTLLHTGIQPGASIFVGQYLFTGSETSSVYLTVQEVRTTDHNADHST